MRSWTGESYFKQQTVAKSSVGLVKRSPRDFDHVSGPVALLSMFPGWQYRETMEKLDRLEKEVSNECR